MLYYWVVFTLENTVNKYFDMFCLSYKSLKKQSVFQQNDTVILLCDPITAEKANTVQFLNSVLKITVPQPKTVLEGAFLRYRLPEFYSIPQNTVCCYLDVDMLCIRPFRVHCKPDTLMPFPEGPITQDNYCGDMVIDSPVGCSSTFFIYSYSPKIQQLLSQIQGDKKYYTLDQPYYNKALAGFQDLIQYLPQTLISYNGHNNMNSAVFVNLCGEPGNAEFHWYKMLDYFLLTS